MEDLRRVVVVGAGTGAGAHLRALREIGCQVVGVVTRHPGRAANARAIFPDTRVCWPATEALDIGADVAIVASPAGTHLSVVREAARRCARWSAVVRWARSPAGR